MAGYFYAMTNKSYGGLLKLGHVVGRDPEERAKELSRATAVPTPFEVAYSFRCPVPREVETAVHRQFSRRRVRRGREFFRVSVSEVRGFVESQYPAMPYYDRPKSHRREPPHSTSLSPPDHRLLAEIAQAGGLIEWVRAARRSLE